MYIVLIDFEFIMFKFLIVSYGRLGSTDNFIECPAPPRTQVCLNLIAVTPQQFDDNLH